MPMTLPEVAVTFREASATSSTNLPLSVAIEVLCSDSPIEVSALREMIANGLPNAIISGASEELLFGHRVIVGSPETVRVSLELLINQYLPDEVMIVSNCPDPEMRRRSFELVKGICDDI